MIPKLAGTILCAAALLVVPARAQQPPEMTPEEKAEMEAWEKAGTPGPQHQALAGMAGTYDMKVKSWMKPEGPPMEDSGTATRKMDLDGRVLVEHVDATMMGAPFQGHGMMGYDNVTGRFWSTWNDSHSTGIFVSEGTCDAKNSCTFKGTMTDPVTKKSMTSRMTTRWTSPTTEVFEMHAPDKKGKEYKMMEITYTKKG